MAIRALALNAEGAYGDPQHWEDAVSFIEQQKPDVAFLGESHWETPLSRPGELAVATNELIVAESKLALEGLGYQVLRNSDNDASPTRPDRTGFFGIVRAALGQGEIIHMGSRDGYRATVTDPATNETAVVAGQHYDDKDEPTRLRHVGGLPSDTDVLMGDLNNLHRTDKVARLLRLFKPAAALIPTWEYDFTHTQPTLQNRLKTVLHLGKRATGMATGKALRALAKEHGLVDADPTHQPTMNGGPLQLDHIMVGRRVRVSNFTVHEGFPSDHKPISADLHIAQAA